MFARTSVRRYFPVKLIFNSERFVSHFTVFFLKERDLLNKRQQQDSACVVCRYNFASGINFSGNFFAGTLFANSEKNCKN